MIALSDTAPLIPGVSVATITSMIQMLAQTTTTTPIEVVVNTSDGWTAVISIAALLVAFGVGVATWRQGRTINKIETREHEWQATDRKSAHIQVTRWSENIPVARSGTAYNSRLDYVRLTNTGRAPASNVTWAIAQDDNPVRRDHPGTFEKIHPGEHFDLGLALTGEHPGVSAFTASWEDDNGSHTTERLINL